MRWGLRRHEGGDQPWRGGELHGHRGQQLRRPDLHGGPGVHPERYPRALHLGPGDNGRRAAHRRNVRDTEAGGLPLSDMRIGLPRCDCVLRHVFDSSLPVVGPALLTRRSSLNLGRQSMSESIDDRTFRFRQ